MGIPMTPKETINMLRSYRDTRELANVQSSTKVDVEAVVSMFCGLNTGKSSGKK